MPATIFLRDFLEHNQNITHIFFSHSLRGGTGQKLDKARQLLKKKSWQFLAYKILETRGFNLYTKLFKSGKTINGLAKKHGITIERAADVNDPEFIEKIKKSGCNIILSVYSNQLFGKPLIEAAPDACINVHGTLLPDYRGGAGYFHYLADDRDEAGATVHFIVPEADAGDVIWKEKFPIETDDTVYLLHVKLCQAGARAALKALELLKDPDFKAQPIENIQKKLYWMPSPKKMKKFHKLGKKLFTWRHFFKYS
jgi:folate-dependent phosphoribosylglycinamide formyltransferase PurN